MNGIQKSFSPIDYTFEWDGDWYRWDREEAIRQAKAARTAEARRLRAAGYQVRAFSMPDQLVRRGGIGSGHPDVEFYVTAYYLNAF